MTALETLIQTTPGMISCDSCLEAMRQFAWLHVQAALEAACANVDVYTDSGDYPVPTFDRASILTAYPKENIV